MLRAVNSVILAESQSAKNFQNCCNSIWSWRVAQLLHIIILLSERDCCIFAISLPVSLQKINWKGEGGWNVFATQFHKTILSGRRPFMSLLNLVKQNTFAYIRAYCASIALFYVSVKLFYVRVKAAKWFPINSIGKCIYYFVPTSAVLLSINDQFTILEELSSLVGLKVFKSS